MMNSLQLIPTMKIYILQAFDRNHHILIAQIAAVQF